MGSLYTLSRQFSFTHLREVDIPRAAGTHAGILRAVAARDEAAARPRRTAMMEFLLRIHRGQSTRCIREAVANLECEIRETRRKTSLGFGMLVAPRRP